MAFDLFSGTQTDNIFSLGAPNQGAITRAVSPDIADNPETITNSGGISSGIGAAGYSAAISSFGNILGGFAQTSAYKAKLNAETNAIIRGLENATKSFAQQMSLMKGQEQDIEQQLFSKLSQRGIEAIKAESRLRTAAAETGTTGGTTDAAIDQAYMDYVMDAALITQDAKYKQKDLTRRMETLRLSLSNKISGSEVISPNYKTNAVVSGLSGGVTGFKNIYEFLGEEQRRELFDFN